MLSFSFLMALIVESLRTHTAFFLYGPLREWKRSMSSSAVIAVADAAVIPTSAPPVALRMPVGFPFPSPVKKAAYSFAPILLPNSVAM